MRPGRRFNEFHSPGPILDAGQESEILAIGTTQFSRHDGLREVDVEVGERKAIAFRVTGAKAVMARRARVIGVVAARVTDRRRSDRLQPEVFGILLMPSQLTRFSDNDE